MYNGIVLRENFTGDHAGTWYRIWGIMLYRFMLAQQGRFWRSLLLGPIGSVLIGSEYQNAKALAVSSFAEWVKFAGDEFEDDFRKAEINRKGAMIADAMLVNFENRKKFKDGISQDFKSEILFSLKKIEKSIGRKFGDKDACPLLVSIRSGSPVSMPGMMDTILNVGINDSTVLSLAKAFGGDYNFAFDCQRRFIEMYSSSVLKIDKDHFEAIHARYRSCKDVKLTEADWRNLIKEYKAFVVSNDRSKERERKIFLEEQDEDCA
jgi:hypothetical protein